MHHCFDVDLAKKYGIAQAVILENLAYWVIYNRSLSQNQVDGKFWTYNSLPALNEQFPYLNERQIKYAFQKLREEGLILTRKLSEDKMNKTNWYTLSEKGERECRVTFAMGQNCTMHGTKAKMTGQNCSVDGTNLYHVKDLLHSTNINNTIQTNPPTPQGKNAEKIEYAEYVKMKPTEYEKLVEEFGEPATKEIISILDNYKGAKGVTYKDDYRAIRNWVIKRWKEEHQEKQQPKTFAERDRDNFLKTIQEMDEIYEQRRH